MRSLDFVRPHSHLISSQSYLVSHGSFSSSVLKWAVISLSSTLFIVIGFSRLTSPKAAFGSFVRDVKNTVQKRANDSSTSADKKNTNFSKVVRNCSGTLYQKRRPVNAHTVLNKNMRRTSIVAGANYFTLGRSRSNVEPRRAYVLPPNLARGLYPSRLTFGFPSPAPASFSK